MKKKIFLFCALTCFVIFIGLTSFKDTNKTSVNSDCDLKGTYAGKSFSSKGAASAMVYSFQESNLAVGSSTPGGPGVTFGGYKNTCDSVFISVYYSGGNNYYKLKGQLTDNMATITGTFENLSNPKDFGSFKISKW